MKKILIAASFLYSVFGLTSVQATDAQSLIKRSLISNIGDAINILESKAYINKTHRTYDWRPDVVCWEEGFRDKFDEIYTQIVFLNIDILFGTSANLKSYCISQGADAGFALESNIKSKWISNLKSIQTVLNLK